MTLDHPKVKKIIAQCERRVKKLTGNAAVLLMFHNPKKAIPFEAIVEAVCNVSDITNEEVLKRCRKREIVTARQLICFYAKRYSRMSHKKISERLGYLDHTTSVNGIKVIKNLIDTNNEDVTDAVTQINELLNVKQ